METTGVVRRIDDLGRIVIPKEIRRTLGIKDGTSLEIFVEKDVIALKKHSSMNNLLRFAMVYAESISTSLKKDVIITDRDNIIAYTGKDKKKYLNKPISSFLEGCIASRKDVIEYEKTNLFLTNDNSENCSFALNLISANGDAIGLIIIFTSDDEINDFDIGVTKIASLFLGKNIEE